jgi:superfamily I DNA/RNA helicase
VRRDVVSAVRGFLNQVPAAPHPERVRNARDPRVATLRLADRHRGVILRQRDVHWLLTVLPDGEAWGYAHRFEFGVNPEIGVIEMWDAGWLDQVAPALGRAAESTDSRLFDWICDNDLASVGVDARALPYVRMITNEATLQALEPLLPPTQYAPLAELAARRSLASAWRVLDACRTAVRGPEPVDPEDVTAALLRSPDRAVFVADDAALDRVLNLPHWCVFLQPPQHRLARTPHYDRPVLVTGGAGTGKTLIALHRAAHLAAEGRGTVLLVTFSQVLSRQLAAKLDLLIPDEMLRKRVEVGNVDRLAHRIVTEAEGHQPGLVGASELASLWHDAIEESRRPADAVTTDRHVRHAQDAPETVSAALDEPGTVPQAQDAPQTASVDQDASQSTPAEPNAAWSAQKGLDTAQSAPAEPNAAQSTQEGSDTPQTAQGDQDASQGAPEALHTSAIIPTNHDASDSVISERDGVSQDPQNPVASEAKDTPDDRDGVAAGRHGPAFLLREWEQVVLAQNLTTLEEYLGAERPGRSVDLDDGERTAIWRTIGLVATRLRESGRRTLLQLAAEASTLLSQTTGDLLDGAGPLREPYRHIVVDEAQDLHPAQWRLLRAAVPYARDDLFIVGDPHQRIFDTRVPLGSVGIEAAHRELQVSYRLPQEILNWAVRLRGGGPADGLVEGVQQLAGLRSAEHGHRPIVRAYDSPEAELAGLVAWVGEWVADGVPVDRIGIAARSGELVRAARAAVREAGLGVRVSTLHGMKGLEFQRVAVIGVTDGIVPSPEALTPAGEDPAARAHDLQRERGLLYVACTRAGEMLYVSHSGRASPFLPP